MSMGVRGSGEGVLLLVLPLIWAWGAAMYSSRPARKRASDWQVGSESNVCALLLASYRSYFKTQTFQSKNFEELG